ncbi:ECF transporter S component [Desulfofalx alkaliphila]|uniref:ECF transporter S component n=1 Tax=Desulfofalx alkaliphila TaxID=105483 RepID=UPI0004E1367B|nr:ECF transporter S component [Desulfofalx alkaliphila]
MIWQKFIARFSVLDLITIAMISAMGIATKPIIVPIAHIITGPLLIPGGVVAGGFYMMWPVLGAGLVGKGGAATLIGFVQALLIFGTGLFGSHGVMTLVSYTLPGVTIDLALWLIRHRVCCLPCAFLAGMAANICGATLVNILFFRLPLVPLMLALTVAALSGGLGGIIAYKVLLQLKKTGLVQKTLDDGNSTP